ncbi:MAG: ABC transporter permease [Mobilitalea sp.]
MLNIIIKEVKEFFRDTTNLFFFMAFPIVLVFLLGSLLNSLNKSEGTIGELKIEYVIETQDPYQIMAIESFVDEAGDGTNLFFTAADNLEKAKKMAAKDEIAAVVLFTGNPMEIQIFEGTDSIKNRTVGAIMYSFIQTNKSISTLLKTNPEGIAEISAKSIQEDYIIDKDLGVNRNMIDYYAVSMVAMICFMSLTVGAAAFVGERQSKTINRLLICPKNRISIFIQKVLGFFPQVVLEIAVIMLFCVVVYKAHYAANIQDNLYLFLMFLVVTISMTAVGAVLGLFMKSSPTVVIMPVIWMMMFFGGTYSKDLYIKGLTEMMPIYNMQQAAYDLSIFGRTEKATTTIIIYSIICIIALIIGAVLFNRKKEEA